MPRSSQAKQQTESSFICTQVTETHRYYFDLNPESHRDIVIVCGGCAPIT